MGDLKRGFKRGLRSIKKAGKHALRSFKEGSKQIGEALGYGSVGVVSDKTKREIAAANAPEPAIPIADEEELRRARRRRLAGQPRSGRASTILTSDEDTLG